MNLDCTPEELAQFLGIAKARQAHGAPQGEGDWLVDDLRAELNNRLVLQQGAADRIRDLEERNAAGAESLAALQRAHEARGGDLQRAREQARLHEQRATELNGEVGRLTGLLAEARAQQARSDAAPTGSARPPIRGTRRLPTILGGPGADVGDGLDVWRVDGSGLVNELRRQARAAGASQDHINGMRAYSDVDYARLVRALERVERTGAYGNPVAGLAEIVGRTVDSLRAPLRGAHEVGVATAPAKMGHPGGPQRLTEKGHAVLAQADAPTTDQEETGRG